MGVFVHDYRHARNKHENGWYRYLTVITLVQDHNGLLLRGFTIFPLMFGNEDPKKCLLLVLESKCGLKIQVPTVLVQRRYDCYARLPWDPSTFTVAFIVQQFCPLGKGL